MRMRKPRPSLVFVALLFFGLFLALPGEDLAETAYDESESQPCASTVELIGVIALPVATHIPPRSPHRSSALPSAPTSRYRPSAAKSDTAGPRLALALHATLLC
jgi:hypothetical protein